jgi:hypothetical protein
MEEEQLLWSSLPIRPEIRSNTGGTIESFEQGWTQILAKDAYPAFRRILAATQQVSNFLAEFAHPRANSANTIIGLFTIISIMTIIAIMQIIAH